jgi:mRNA interferase RelE/StbE
VIVKYRRSFAKDLARINSHSMKVRIHKVIDEVKNASSLLDLPNVKQLQGHSGYYRIRVGDYRLGLKARGDSVTFVRVLHRKDIYRKFP